MLDLVPGNGELLLTAELFYSIPLLLLTHLFIFTTSLRGHVLSSLEQFLEFGLFPMAGKLGRAEPSYL